MMSLKMVQHMAMKQQLRMTQQLQQAIKLLQLTKMELISHIQQELTENPTLEELSIQDTSEKSALMDERPMPETEGPVAELTGEPVKSDEIDWSAYMEYMNGGGLPQNNYKGMITEELPSIEATLSTSPSLAEHLLMQLRLTHFDEDQEHCAAFIIGNLNEDGYLSGITLEEIAEKTGVDMDTAEYVLEVVQEFDPIGVAARDLRECLLVQCEVHYPDDDNLHRVVSDHIINLQKKNYDGIARALKLPVEEVLRCAKLVSKMDPKPGRKYTDERPQYITPDIYITKIGDEYHVVLNEDGMPKLRISQYYSTMVNSENGKEVNSYIRDKLAGARWLIRSIHQRQRTILKVTEAIVAKQRDFFDKGIAHLKPMVLKDIADETGLHESTVSRVTSKKYVHTPQGTFELKFFFNSRITRTGGEDLASESVKEKIRTIIGAEDPRKPYSDQKIAAMLRQQNIKIARRTVAKYRESLGILSSTQRKSYF